jgi:16S rRNA C1402 N4-methylase RsmH
MARLNLVELAQLRARQHLGAGAIAVDATVGNGHDTLMLAQQVGEQGRVYGFDIQPQALTETRERLDQAGVLERVQLIAGSHAEMAALLPAEAHQQIDLVMFNLGYLPGGDKSIITEQSATLQALEAALSLLSVNGAVSIIAYPGHAGGDSECDRVSHWCEQLDFEKYSIEKVIPETVKRRPPQWFWISVV